MAKYIFLDIDGVLNYSGCRANCGPCVGIDNANAKKLAEIVRATGAKIILSSTWRKLWFRNDKEEQDEMANYLDRKLRRVGLRVYDKTRDIDDGRRGAEVLDYLDRFPASSFIILDDEVYEDFNESTLENRFIMTDYNTGLTDSDVTRAIEILNGERDIETNDEIEEDIDDEER